MCVDLQPRAPQTQPPSQLMDSTDGFSLGCRVNKKKPQSSYNNEAANGPMCD